MATADVTVIDMMLIVIEDKNWDEMQMHTDSTP